MGFRSLVAWWLGGVDQTIETEPPPTGVGVGKTGCVSVSRDRTVPVLRDRTVYISRDCRR